MNVENRERSLHAQPVRGARDSPRVGAVAGRVLRRFRGVSESRITKKSRTFAIVSPCFIKTTEMYTTYHLSSAQEVSSELVEAIKAIFKTKPITITVEEEMDSTAYLLSSAANKAMLEKSMEQDRNGEHVRVKFSDL